MALEFVSFLQAVFFFIELVIYKRICSAQIIDCLSNNQKWKALTTFIMELYDSVMKMIVKKCLVFISFDFIYFLLRQDSALFSKYNR